MRTLTGDTYIRTGAQPRGLVDDNNKKKKLPPADFCAVKSQCSGEEKKNKEIVEKKIHFPRLASSIRGFNFNMMMAICALEKMKSKHNNSDMLAIIIKWK